MHIQPIQPHTFVQPCLKKGLNYSQVNINSAQLFTPIVITMLRHIPVLCYKLLIIFKFRYPVYDSPICVQVTLELTG